MVKMADLNEGPLSTENSFEHVPGMPGETAGDAGAGAEVEPEAPALFGKAEEGSEDPIPVFGGMNVENMAIDQGGGHDRLLWFFEETAPKGYLCMLVRAARSMAVPGSFKLVVALPVSPTGRPRGPWWRRSTLMGTTRTGRSRWLSLSSTRTFFSRALSSGGTTQMLLAARSSPLAARPACGQTRRTW